MKVNTKSWHYKIWVASFMNSLPWKTTTLCNYFWRVVLFSLMWFVIGSLALGGAGSFIYYGLYKTYVGWMFIASVLSVLLLVQGIKWSTNAILDWYDGRPPREPGLFMQYMKAKKQKLCPIIEFEEDDDVEVV